MPVFLTGTCVCAWENSEESLQNSMDECQVRWNVSDVCERTSSSGSYMVPLLRSRDGEHDQHHATHTSHIVSGRLMAH